MDNDSIMSMNINAAMQECSMLCSDLCTLLRFMHICTSVGFVLSQTLISQVVFCICVS